MAENNFLHRDLKLANIFLSDGRAVIADFGFAKKNSYYSANF
jgi:serine/threonine protein kinase